MEFEKHENGSLIIPLHKDFKEAYVAYVATRVVHKFEYGIDYSAWFFDPGSNNWWINNLGLNTYPLLPNNWIVISIDTEYENKAYLQCYFHQDTERCQKLANLIHDALYEKVNTMRPEVRKFAECMEAKLLKNAHRGGWQDCTDTYLLEMLYEHIEKLKFSLVNGHQLQGQEAKDKVSADAADCANLVMMLQDNFSRRVDV